MRRDMVGGLVFRKGQSTNVTSRLKGARINKTQVIGPIVSAAPISLGSTATKPDDCDGGAIVPRSRTVINTDRASLDVAERKSPENGSCTWRFWTRGVVSRLADSLALASGNCSRGIPKVLVKLSNVPCKIWRRARNAAYAIVHYISLKFKALRVSFRVYKLALDKVCTVSEGKIIASAIPVE